MLFHSGDGRTQAFTMLMAAAGVLYAAGRIAIFALARPDGADPGRRAIGQWAPIAGAAIAAVCMNRADIALALILGTSVAFLSLALGMVCWLHPLEALPPSRKLWPFVFPAAMLVLLAGFNSHLAWWHALMLLALGGAIVGVWRQSPEAMHGETSPGGKIPVGQVTLAMIFVAVLIALGGHLAVKGTLASCSFRDGNNRLIYPGTLAATILSPLLILPTLGTASSVAQQGHSGRAVTSLVGSALLNLCLLLPLSILLWHFRPEGWQPEVSALFHMKWDRAHGLPFDIVAWQLETVFLVVLGFGLIPLSMGRWVVSRAEAGLLIVAYGVYIIMLAVFGVQQM